jgi:hypothetical protein
MNFLLMAIKQSHVGFQPIHARYQDIGFQGYAIQIHIG